jgi:hypothetical protein
MDPREVPLMLLLARIVRTVATVVASVIVAGILLFVLGANQSNEIVSAVMDAGRWLVGPFDGLFTMDSAKWELAVNWGIAAAVYAFVGSLIARLLARAAIAGRERRARRRRGWGFGRFGRRRPVA